MTSNRPLVVCVLSGMAFLVSAAFAVALALSLKSMAEEISVQDPSAIFMLSLLWFSLAALAWIFAAIGRDLWALRSRGRSLALVSLCLLALAGAGLCFGNL